jgi:hypothetical protein
VCSFLVFLMVEDVDVKVKAFKVGYSRLQNNFLIMGKVKVRGFQVI